MIQKYAKFLLHIALLLLIVHFGSVEVKANFTDVTSYEKEINYLTEKNIINGYSDGTFKPENNVTRIQAARMLIRELNPSLSNLPELQFYDIATNNSDYETIQKALALSIFSGKKDTNGTYFDSYANLTRAQLAKVLVEAYGITENKDKAVYFKDVPENAWYKKYVEILASNGIVTGYEDQTFRPNESLKRKHFAAIYYRFLTQEKQAQSDDETIIAFGVAKTDSGIPLKNTDVTFTANQYSYKAMTDEHGNIEIRLPKNKEFNIEANGLQGTIKIEDVQTVISTFESGSITFGVDLSTDDATILLAPASRYIEDNSTVKSLKDDLTSLVMTSDEDIKIGDVLVFDGNENDPSGVALKVTSIKEEDGLYYMETEQPSIEEVYTELVGSFNVSIDQSEFILPEGATYTNQTNSNASIRSSLQGNPQIAFNLAKISAKNFEIKSSVAMGADFDFDIDWHFGLDPVNSMHFEMKSFANLGIELGTSTNEGCAHPWKQVLEECLYPLSAKEITVPVGIPGVTVAFQPFLQLDGTINGTLKGKLETTQHVGIDYTRETGKEDFPSEKFHSLLSNVEASGGVNATVKVILNAEVEGLKLGLVSGYIGGGTEIEGQLVSRVANTSDNISGGTCLAVSAKLVADGAFGIPIINKEIGNFTLAKKEIYGSEIGQCVTDIVVAPSNLQLTPGEAKSISVGFLEGDKINLLPDLNEDSYQNIDIVAHNKDIATAKMVDGNIIITAAENAAHKQTAKFTINLSRPFGKTISKTFNVEINSVGQLVGAVEDILTEKPVKDAKVSAIQEGKVIDTIDTADDGIYQLDLPVGTYQLVVEKQGYLKDESTITINQAQVKTYDSKLLLIGDDLDGVSEVSGTAIHSLTGDTLANVTLQILKGRNVEGDGQVVETVQTDANGNYHVTLPIGLYTIKSSDNRFTESRVNVIAFPNKKSANNNIVLSPKIKDLGSKDSEYEIILTWGEKPLDLDTHFTGFTAGYYEYINVWYTMLKKITNAGNIIQLDLDDTSSFGPETLTISRPIENGTFEYFVHNYSVNPDIKASNARVQVYHQQKLIRTYNVPMEGEGTSWSVFKFVDGKIIDTNFLRY